MVAFNVMGKLPLAVGVPEMTAPLRARGVGRVLVLKVEAVGLDVIV